MGRAKARFPGPSLLTAGPPCVILSALPLIGAAAHPAARKEHRGISSVGRARQWHCRGQGFDSPTLHQFFRLVVRRGRKVARCAGADEGKPGWLLARVPDPLQVR